MVSQKSRSDGNQREQQNQANHCGRNNRHTAGDTKAERTVSRLFDSVRNDRIGIVTESFQQRPEDSEDNQGATIGKPDANHVAPAEGQQGIDIGLLVAGIVAFALLTDLRAQ